jgi:hypothetical protein
MEKVICLFDLVFEFCFNAERICVESTLSSPQKADSRQQQQQQQQQQQPADAASPVVNEIPSTALRRSDNVVLPIIVFCYNRAAYLNQTLTTLFKYELKRTRCCALYLLNIDAQLQQISRRTVIASDFRFASLKSTLCLFIVKRLLFG